MVVEGSLPVCQTHQQQISNIQKKKNFLFFNNQLQNRYFVSYQTLPTIQPVTSWLSSCLQRSNSYITFYSVKHIQVWRSFCSEFSNYFFQIISSAEKCNKYNSKIHQPLYLVSFLTRTLSSGKYQTKKQGKHFVLKVSGKIQPSIHLRS